MMTQIFEPGGFTMKRHPYIALFVLMIVTLACVVPGAAPDASATPVPSNTSEPTATSAPTDTPTPLPTSTPDAAATAAVRATQSAGDALSELNKLLGDTDVPYKDGHLAWQQDKQVSIEMDGPSYKVVDVDKDLTASNFILKSDVTWEASGIIVCGATFRSEDDLEQGKQYQFKYLRLSGLPAWSIDVHEFGRFKNSPTKTKFSDAVDMGNGATNSFVLVVQDDNFTTYINGARQGRYFDYSKQRMDGVFGFLGYQDSGNGTCEYENSWVWSLD
jgi:hypothetical protein